MAAPRLQSGWASKNSASPSVSVVASLTPCLVAGSFPRGLSGKTAMPMDARRTAASPTSLIVDS